MAKISSGVNGDLYVNKCKVADFYHVSVRLWTRDGVDYLDTITLQAGNPKSTVYTLRPVVDSTGYVKLREIDTRIPED